MKPCSAFNVGADMQIQVVYKANALTQPPHVSSHAKTYFIEGLVTTLDIPSLLWHAISLQHSLTAEDGEYFLPSIQPRATLGG